MNNVWITCVDTSRYSETLKGFGMPIIEKEKENPREQLKRKQEPLPYSATNRAVGAEIMNT